MAGQKPTRMPRNSYTGQAIMEAIGSISSSLDEDDFSPDDMIEQPEEVEADLTSLAFAHDIRNLLIPSAAWRIICYFLGFDSVTSVKYTPYSNVTLIGLLVQQNIMAYMEKSGYKFQGEINFDSNEQPIPCTKHCWVLGEQEISFTSGGYMFFKNTNGTTKNDDVIVYSWRDANSGTAGFHVHSNNIDKSKQIIQEIEAYSKLNNCLRGAKIRDVNMISATFEEVKVSGNHTWDNYYFSENIRKMFDLEVFGFLKSVDRYNALNISKRGVLMYGPPGTGKTTIGHVICNYSKHTVLWITPDLIAENNGNKHSIKLLYMLADFVSPCVIILEDLDLFSEDREGVVDQLRLGALMNILDGVNSVRNAVTVATTNRLELIEKALSNRPGRFDRVVEVPTLETSLRRKMLISRLSGCTVADSVIESLVIKTEGWTPAELQELINTMNLYFINLEQENNRVVTEEVVSNVLSVMTKYCVGRASKKRIGFAD